MKEVGTGYTFYNYYYTIESTKITKNLEAKLLYLNTSYFITLVGYT